MAKSICGILLAAGHSVRFGSQKLLHPLADGDSIGIVSAKNLKRVVRNSLAVVANDTDDLARLLTEEGYALVRNTNNRGIGSSIACGVKHTRADAYIITLADMPYIHCETIHQIAHLLHSGSRIVVPLRNGRRGHPVGFNKIYRSELLALHSDLGARSVIEKNLQDVTFMNTSDFGCFHDIDKQEDISK